MGKNIKLIVSAINLVDGGPLSILRDSLVAFDKKNKNNYLGKIIYLVSSPKVHEGLDIKNIHFEYFPLAKKSWLIRLYYEYLYFYFFSKNKNIDTWLSLHDITPNVISKKRVVYCHNSSMFFKFPLKDILLDLKQFLFSRFYKYLYKINIKKNDYVVVQQEWMADEFKRIFKINELIVATPDLSNDFINLKSEKDKRHESKKIFYPAFPRYFKNHSIIFKASLIFKNIDFLVTTNGNENRYIKKTSKKFLKNKNILFLGLLNREEVFKKYHESDFLIFPSLLETWGLPLTEYRNLNKPIICAKLPYAMETLYGYEKIYWFDPYNLSSLEKAINRAINNENYDKNPFIKKSIKARFVNGWDEFVEFFEKN